eukprot:scaffold63058_cov69-Attheya_sp.AAC.1
MTAPISRADVASLLCVPEGALDLVTLSNEICMAKGCNAMAVKSNYQKCAFHGKKWFPCKHAAAGGKELLVNRRGYELLGPEYQRCFGTNKPSSCCCDLEACVGIGYSHHGMFRLPTDQTHLLIFLEKLPVSSKKKALMKENPRSYHVAPWHFSLDHRKRDENGKWSLRQRDSGVYYDGDRKKYPFPPPNYNPRDFITEVRSAKHGIERTCTTQEDLSSLPAPLCNRSRERRRFLLSLLPG